MKPLGMALIVLAACAAEQRPTSVPIVCEASAAAIQPLSHTEDITGVMPLTVRAGGTKQTGARTVGAVVTLRPTPGMTTERLQYAIECQLARDKEIASADAGCTLVPRDTSVRVSSTGDGFAVAIQSYDMDVSRSIVACADRLIPGR
jgi:hypothetical protein